METATTIALRLNGAATTVPAGTTLAGLLERYGIERRMVAVEYNGEILPRHRYDETVLQPGDELEVVHMVGGG